MVTLYTTAPEDYDYAGVVTLDPAVGTLRGKVVRLVQVPEYRATEQRDRYVSGFHYAGAELPELD